MTLIEFLLARVDEDEAALRSMMRTYCDDEAHWDDRRVIAECTVKRRLVTEVHHDRGGTYTQRGECAGCGQGGGYGVAIDDCPTLRVIASVYADHDDYQPRWREP